MPLYALKWSRSNPPIDGVEQEPWVFMTQVSGSTPDNAIARALADGIPADLAHIDPTWDELDEDGEVVRSS